MSVAEHIAAAEHDPSNYVHLTGATVSAHVTFEDPEIAELLAQAPEGRRVEFFIRGARSGLIAMGNDMTGRLREAMRFMQATLDTQVSSFGDRIIGKVAEQLGDADKDGHVQKRVQELLARAATDLKTSIEKALPDAFDGQTKKSVERIQAEGERVMKEMTALFAENGVAWQGIRDAKRDFAARLEEVKVAMTIAQTKAANPTPRDAGLDYEAWVHRQIATIGALRGDDVEFTGGKAGTISRCMKGDTRIVIAAEGVEVTEPPCVAVEIRDREQSEFSLADVEMMKKNREAHAAVIVAAHAGSLPGQYRDRPFARSSRKRLITVVLDPNSADSEALLAAAYDLACVAAIEAVRRSRDGDWDAVARKADEIEQAVSSMVEARNALSLIERKARDAGLNADKGYAQIVRLLSDLRAVVQTQ
jgi:hypothetical protein